MEIEVSAQTKDKKLNRMVAITVVVFSVFTGVCNIKDGNLVQAMQQAKADSIDSWGEYQATKTKLHIAETARDEIGIMMSDATASGQAVAQTTLARLKADIIKYRASAPKLQARAQGQAAQYYALNVHDDQFDASEALISTAISMAAVAALAESSGLLFGSWLFGAFGILLGVCGFAKWAFHPDVLSNFLG